MANSNRINFSDVLCSGVETINNATATAPTAPAGTIIHVVQADATSARIGGDAFASQVFFTARRANGTSAAPTNLVANDQIGGFNFHGYGATGYVGPAATVSGFAAGTWSDTSSPAYIDLRTTPAASLTMVTRLRVESDGGITVPNTATGGSQGAGTINVSGGYYINGVAIPGGTALPQFTRVGIGAAADATNLLTIVGGTVTAATLLINSTITWNNGAVVFTGMRQNVTNTASDATSMLFDFQVGGTSTVHALVTGQIRSGLGSASAPTYAFTARPSNGMYSSGNGIVGFAAGTVQIASISATGIVGMLALSISASPFTTADVVLSRSAANALEMINGTNTQTFRVNGPFTDASNFMALAIIGNQLVSQTTGTGFPRTASAPVLDMAQTWNNAGVTFTGWKLNITSTASAAASLLMDLQVGGITQLNCNKTGTLAVAADFIAGMTSSLYGTFGTKMRQESSISWTNNIAYTNTVDLNIFRDAPGIAALRVGTAAQAIRVYNTFTSTTSLEYFAIDWQTAANVCSLWTVKGSGGGTARNLVLGTDATARLTIGATSGDITITGTLICGTAGKSFQITTGTGQRAGNATLVGGTTTVTNTTVTANTIVLLTRKTSGGTIGTAITYTLSAGASFTINSDNILDTSTFSYLLFELV